MINGHGGTENERFIYWFVFRYYNLDNCYIINLVGLWEGYMITLMADSCVNTHAFSDYLVKCVLWVG